MLASLRIRRTVQLLALALVASAAAACDDDDPAGPDEDEPEVATMRLTVGASTVNVAENGTVTGGPLVFTSGAAVTAQFLRADGTPDPIANGAEFRLEVVPTTPANLTFARTGPFTGTLTSTIAAGQQTTATFSLFHVEEQHNDFGPFPVTLQRQ